MLDRPGHYDYMPWRRRPRITWPNGARIAVWVAPNIEHYELNPPPNPRRSFVSEPSARYYNPGAAKPAMASMPPAPPMKSRDLGGLRIGQSVQHARFGDGVIISAEGSGNDARVQVKFAEAGTKWLMLAVAKLTPA